MNKKKRGFWWVGLCLFVLTLGVSRPVLVAEIAKLNLQRGHELAGLLAGSARQQQGTNDAADQKAAVYIYRYKQFNGAALEPSIFVDDHEVARMDNGRYFILQVPGGTHSFRSNDKQSGIEIEMKPGEMHFVRVEIATGFLKGHGRLVHMMPDQGRFEIKKLQYLGSDKIKDKELVLPRPLSLEVPR